MEEIIFRQRDAAKALNGKTFLLAVASVVLRLALAQIIVNLLIKATGVGLISIAFYLYAIWLLVGFMRRTVASHVYTLKQETLVLERRLGDSTTTVVEIPLSSIVSLRPVYAAERLKLSYKQVTVIDPACKTPLAMRAAFLASLFSAHLARVIAGRRTDRKLGHVAVYEENGRRKACVFRPNAEMCEALAAAIPKPFGFDERETGARDTSLMGRSLERAFPAYYGFVEPLVRPEDIERADAEIKRQKDERKAAREARSKAEKARREAQKTAKETSKKEAAERKNQKNQKDAPKPEQENPQGEHRRRRNPKVQ